MSALYLNCLFKILAKTIWKLVSTSIFKLIYSVIEDQGHIDLRYPPDFDYLLVAKLINQMIQLIQTHFQASVLPAMIDSASICRDVIVFKNDFLARLETKLNLILQKHLASVMAWIEVLLARQKKTDYKPKDEASTATTAVKTLSH